MPPRLRRGYGADHLHFISTTCYHRQPLFSSSLRRDLFLETLEQVRQNYHFVVVGYVVMLEHVHLLINESERGNTAMVMQVLKHRFACQVLRMVRTSGDLASAPEEPHFWQRRYYDFLIWTHEKRMEKLRYVHLNPVKRGLVANPEDWKWSSFRYYAYGEVGPVLVNEQIPAVLKVRNVSGD